MPKSNKIFYWGPYGENIGTVKGMLNSALAVREFSDNTPAMISCCGEWHEFSSELKAAGIDIHSLNLHRLWPSALPKNGRWYRLFMFFVLLLSPFKLARLINRQKPDYIITCLLAIPVILARCLSRHKPKIVAIVWGLPSFLMREGDKKSSLMRRIENRIRLFMWRRLYNKIEFIAATSQNTRDKITSTFGYSQQKVLRLYAPVASQDITEKAAQPCVHHWLKNKDTPVIIGLGRLSRQKGFDILINAFAKVRQQGAQARLIILGEGDNRNKLQEIINSHKLEDCVELAGFFPNPYSFLRAADMFVLSSRWEDPCHAIIEAGYVGVPIVTTDCPSGPGEFIGFGEGGYICGVDDIEGMATAITECLKSDSSAKTEYCIQKCEDYYTPQAHYRLLAQALELQTQE